MTAIGILPLTPREAQVQQQIDAFKNKPYSEILATYGDLKPKYHPTFKDSMWGGNMEAARDHYTLGSGRSYYCYQAKSYALSVLTTLPALPAKICYSVAHYFSQASVQRTEMLARDVEDLKDAATFLTAGTLFALGNAALALLLDPLTLLYRYVDQTFIRPGPRAALLIVDPQYDFFPAADIEIDGTLYHCNEGALAVKDAWATVPVIAKIQRAFKGLTIGCMDDHPIDQGATCVMLGVNDITLTTLDGIPQMAWPIHCVQGSRGQKYVPGIIMGLISRIFPKGRKMRVDSYSAFYDNGHKNKTLAPEYLKSKGITHLYVTGLAFDYCVGYSALDAQSEGFKTTVIEDATRSVAEDSREAMREKLTKAGVSIVDSATLVNNPFFSFPANS